MTGVAGSGQCGGGAIRLKWHRWGVMTLREFGSRVMRAVPHDSALHVLPGAGTAISGADGAGTAGLD